MTAKTRRRDAKKMRQKDEGSVTPSANHTIADRAPIKAMNESQRRYIASIKSNIVTIGQGPAGTGKTWLCTALAAQALEEKQIEKVIITRPAVEAGESLGFLPGEKEQKFDPYLQPFKDVLNERLGTGAVDYFLRHGQIEAVPLAYMRGRTFKNAFVILDEAQNTTPAQMKMFLTRIGPNCTVVVNGDIKQTDLKVPSGLSDACMRLVNVPLIRQVEFGIEDVVRSGIVGHILAAYES